MGKGFDFIRDIANSVVDARALNYGVSKATNILLDLKIEDAIIKQLLVKHFDILYKDAENILNDAKVYRK